MPALPILPRRPWIAAVRLLLIATLGYLAACALIAWRKDDLLFTDRGRERAAGRAAPQGFASWWLTMTDGTRIESWWRPAAGATPTSPSPAVIIFHGNGELIDETTDYAEAWWPLSIGVLLVEYRGYGRSEGAPGLTACMADAAAWFDRLTAEPGVSADLILVHGFSLGGIFAAELAARRPVAGLILEGTVASLRRAALDRKVAVLFTRERFDSVAVLQALDPAVPVLLTHGKNDTVVPFHHHALLHQARPGAMVATGNYGHFPLALCKRRDLLARVLAAAQAATPTAIPMGSPPSDDSPSVP